MFNATTISMLASAPFVVMAPDLGARAPFEEIELTFPGGADGVTLAGTLTLPKGPGPHPVVVLVSGSGPQDRDSTIFGQQPFLAIAEYLTPRGIAVLRYDDRGIALSTGDHATATTDDFADDAAAAIELLRKRADIAPGRIGVIGHSEGGVIGSLLVASNRVPGPVVMLGGTFIDGATILRDQTETLVNAAGTATPEQKQAIQLAHKAFTDALIAEESDETILERGAELIAAQSLGAMGLTRARILAATQFEQLASPWLRRFVGLDPAPLAAQSRVPILALFGSLDFQVPPRLNEEPARRILADVPRSMVVVLEGKNHMFQNATTGMMDEYGEIDHAIAEDVLEIIEQWLKDQFSEIP